MYASPNSSAVGQPSGIGIDTGDAVASLEFGVDLSLGFDALGCTWPVQPDTATRATVETIKAMPKR
jgi:hypothetical protein